MKCTVTYQYVGLKAFCTAEGDLDQAVPNCLNCWVPLRNYPGERIRVNLQTELYSLGKVKQTETSKFCASFAVVSFLTVLLLLMLDMEVHSRNTVLTPGPHLLSAAWCVVLRTSDVVAEFSSNGKWRHDQSTNGRKLSKCWKL